MTSGVLLTIEIAFLPPFAIVIFAFFFAVRWSLFLRTALL